MSGRFCNCKSCKRLRRKGLVLGTRYMGFWLSRVYYNNAVPQYYFGPVSDYVTHPRFAPGRRPDPKFDKNNIEEDN